MKIKVLSILMICLISTSGYSQAITLDPSLGDETLRIKENGIGLSHENETGVVKFGTWIGATSAYLQTHTNHPINFSTNNGTAHMTLATSGFLGLGKTSPNAKLHVNGSTILSEGSSSTDQVRIGLTAFDADAKVSIANTSFPYGLKVDGGGIGGKGLLVNDGILINGSSLFSDPVEFQDDVLIDASKTLTVGSLNYSGTLTSSSGATFGGVLVSNSLETGSISGPSSGPVNMSGLNMSGNIFSTFGANFGGLLQANSVETSTINGLSGSLINMNNSVAVSGDLAVSGTLSKSSGTFKIDHPLDPKNKYLYHSFVESPDMMNVYNGNIHTDDEGNATVTLPDYFEALNIDFRYQLTPIGQFAQAIVLEEIAGNSFKIKTDKPNVKVSWQVTGVRNDTYAKENRVKVNVEKPKAEKGQLLYTSKATKDGGEM